VRRNKDLTRADKVRRLLAKGWDPVEIAEELSGGDKKKALSIRTQIYRLAEDEKVQLAIGQASKGAATLAVLPATEALVRRATRGNIPAIKLLYEASGFHSSQIDHKHSGKVEIAFTGVQRAPLIVDETAAGPIVDADVVEE
jgi:hypothetical protein